MRLHETHEARTVKPRFEVPPPPGDSDVELRIETPRLPSDRPTEPRVEKPRPRADRVSHVGLVALRRGPLVVATAVCALGAHVAVSRMIRGRAASEPTSATQEATQTAPAPPALDAPFAPTVDSSTAAAPTVAPSEVAARAAAAPPRSKARLQPRSKRGIRPGSH
jgi:hypothetical protein